MRRHLRDHGLLYILVSLWLACWFAQWFVEVPLDANAEDATPTLQWLAHTFENDASEFLQLSSFVLLTKYFFFKGSHESKDPPE